MHALTNVLGEDGIFVMQVGSADEIDEPPEQFFPHDNFSSFLTLLQAAGFESILDYDEAHVRFGNSWSFLIAMKDSDTRANWFINEAEMELEIYRRTVKTKNGKSPIVFFDGASMMHYQFPSRIVETTWCLGHEEECADGHGFDPEVSNIPVSSLEVRASVAAPGGRGVFTTTFIPKGSLIGMEECVHSIFAPSHTVEVMEQSTYGFRDKSEFWDVVDSLYFDGYGWSGSFYVRNYDYTIETVQ